MAQVYIPKQKNNAAAPSKTNYVIAVVTFLSTAIFVFVGFYQVIPPTEAPSTAAVTEFSSARAREHLEVIAQKPRPAGSIEHAKARDYIVQQLTAMGVSPEIQKTTAINEMWGGPFQAGTVENIIARLKGADSGKTLMVAGHYDSVATSPGAGDCGSCVAAMLETLRALKMGPSLRNDVLFLFTDGEENGLLGSTAFMKEYAGAKDVAIALNLEARGTGGPSIMFETSDGNGWLIKEFARASPYPVANSLSYEIYKRLPNDTDLTVFRRAGLAGLNFAFINGVNRYHTPLDSIENIDERSLQHHGSYTLSLLRHFGNLSLEQSKQGNAVYFNTLGSILIYYSDAWVIPLASLTLALFAAVLIYGFKRKRLTLSGVVLGFFAFLMTMAGAAFTVALSWWLINALRPEYRAIHQGEPYNSQIYFVSFIALTIAITSALYVLFGKKIGMSDLTVGGLIWWALLMVITSLLLPGGSYLFTWPLFFSLIALCFTLSSPDQDCGSMKRSAVLSICAAPGILLFTPMIYLVFLGMTLKMSWALAVMAVLLLGQLIPHINIISSPKKVLLPGASLLISLAFVVAGYLTSGFDKGAGKPNSVFYALNADSGQAVWASFDQSVDEWTSQFFAEKIERGGLRGFAPSTYNAFMKGRAPAISLDAPAITLLSDSIGNNARSLRMRVTSPRQAPVMVLSVDSGAEVLGAAVNGKRIANRIGSQWEVRYYAIPHEGIEVALDVKHAEPLLLRATDISNGLPQLPGFTYKPRPDHLMLSSFPFSDSTVVTKSYTF